jgi:signal transduction histidine kinase/ActR/RegA family two-component response regulator
MTNKKYFVISLVLILTATVIITLSDYWTALNTATLQAETYARSIAGHMSHQLLLQEDPRASMEDPGAFEAYYDSIENFITSFELLNIKIFNRDGIIIFSLNKDIVGRQIRNNDPLSLALQGKYSSNVATPSYSETTYGEKAGFKRLETYVPIIHPETREILGVYEIYQDYRPLKGHIFSETLRSAAAHLILILVFAAIFYRYGRLTSQFMDTRHHSLIKELEDRVEERTVELKRSRDRVSDLLKRKEEMFRNLMIADEYKKNFMGLVSHELRTPLTVIKGYLTMMREGDLGPVYSGLKDVVSTCLEESGKLESIINNILELSQLERGLFDLYGESFDVLELLTEAVQNLGTEVMGREKDIEIEVSREVDNFKSDRIKILQVVQQFLSNALKFSSGGSKIRIKAAPSHRGLLLSVSDEGVGIPRGQVNEVFNLFYQVDISSTRSYEGSGLGLAIVHKIGQILGGRAWVESEVGVGSTFYFEVEALDLPLNDVKETEWPGMVSPDIQPKEVGAASRSILLVDDDEDYLFLLRRILIDKGYTVEMCKDGLEGLNRIFGPGHSHLPALIVLDIRMPNIHGIDFLKIIRRNMTTREIPVIVVSALGQEAQIQEGTSAGANAYFVKPFDPDTLLARIDFLIGRETGNGDG